ncbi:MAG: hypothetical protein GY814_12540, partial [Gammaproteobacteria bacterium]|nr:hypothetical protein [Gammaproteobacteria bacterium]
FGIQLTAQLAAPFKIIIGWITKLAIEMGGMDKLANKFASVFIDGIGYIIKAGAELLMFINKIELGLMKAHRAILKLDKLVTRITFDDELINQIEQKIHSLNEDIRELTNKNHKINIGINTDVKRMLDELKGALGSDSESGGGGALVQPTTIPGSAANDVIFANKKHAEALTVATEKTKQFAEAANQA